MQAIEVTEFGGPEVLVLREVADPAPREGQVLIEVEAAGINYADTHSIENSYLAPTRLPLIPGVEVVGRTRDGRRVLALLPAGGGYAEKAVADPSLMFELTDEMESGAALAAVLQGVTAWHLLRTCGHLAAGERVLIHAGAGGVGSIAIQLAKLWGAGTVVASASTAEKRALCLELGADAVVDPAAGDLDAEIRRAARGPVDVVLEMTGGALTAQSLTSLAPLGRLVFYGMASREAPAPLDPLALLRKSHAVVGFWLAHVFAKPELLRAPVEALITAITAGDLRAVVGGSYPLGRAQRAHEDMRARKTVGKLVLEARGAPASKPTAQADDALVGR